MSIFATSILYPFIVQDAMSVAIAAMRNGFLVTETIDNSQIPVPALLAGTLVASISFNTYDGRPFPDNSQVPVPILLAGTLVVTISFLSYGPTIDNSQVPVPALIDGTLVITIEFIVYNNSLLQPDNAKVAVPTLLAGTLA